MPVPGSYCTGEAGKSANASSSATNLLQNATFNKRPSSPEPTEEDSGAQRSLADQHVDDLASGKRKTRDGEEKKGFNAAKRAEGNEEVEIDKSRLMKALAEEKKRKKMGEDEAWKQTKKGKTDVSQEELGECCFFVRRGEMTLNECCRGVPTYETSIRRSNGQLPRSRGHVIRHIDSLFHHLYIIPCICCHSSDRRNESRCVIDLGMHADR